MSTETISSKITNIDRDINNLEREIQNLDADNSRKSKDATSIMDKISREKDFKRWQHYLVFIHKVRTKVRVTLWTACGL